MTRLRLVGAVLALTVLAGACVGSDAVEVEAVFDDVIDLERQQAVKIADVTVGTVTGVELDDELNAVVSMDVDPRYELPSVVSAQLRKTNLLGERFIELLPDAESGGSFQSGTRITDTRTVPELEETVVAGSEFFAAITADRLAGAIEAGAVGLDGREERLGTTLVELGQIVESFDDNSDDLVRLIQGFERFSADVAPQIDLQGRALAESARFARFLTEEDERLIDALNETQALAQSGTDLIQTHRQRMDDFFLRFEALTGEIVAQGDDLEQLFPDVRDHNFNTIRGVNKEFAQIIADLVVCGINDQPGDPVRACDDPPSRQADPVPRPIQEF